MSARKPLKLKLLQGNPGKQKLNKKEPVYKKKDVDPPQTVKEEPEALEEWERIIPLLKESGIFATIDRSSISAYCLVYARWQDAERKVKKYGAFTKSKTGYVSMNPYVSMINRCLDQIHKYFLEFGMTPAARTRIVVEHPPGQEDELEKELFG